MKKGCMKSLLVLALAGVLTAGGAITSYAQWVSETETGTNADGSTYTTISYYLLDDSTGERITNKEWEGGYLREDGLLIIPEMYLAEGSVKYWAEAGEVGYPSKYVDGTLEWKYNMLKQWSDLVKANAKAGTINMDFQLPQTWSEECPAPLMTSAIDYICFEEWGGWGYFNWTDAWRVDENNVIHITATYYE